MGLGRFTHFLCLPSLFLSRCLVMRQRRCHPVFGNAEPPEKNDILDCEGCKMPGHLKMSSRKWRKAVLQAFDMLPQEPSTLEEWRNSYLAFGRKWPCVPSIRKPPFLRGRCDCVMFLVGEGEGRVGRGRGH